MHTVDAPGLIIRLTAVGMVLAYLIRLDADLWRCRRDAAKAKERSQHVLWIWTVGYGLYLLHILVAFAAYHDWSHAAALEHTARRTAAVTGWHWGGGLWINYALAAWWPVDIVWFGRRGIDRLPRWYVCIVHAIVGFVMFNATVVFGPPWWRWAGAIAILIIAASSVVSRRYRPGRR